MKKLVLLGLVSLSLFANEANEYFNKGVKAYKHKDYTTALKYFKKSCNLGNAQMCVGIGGEYYKGGKFVKQNYKQALKYFKKSCNLGNAQGCEAVGECYFNGIGVESDYKTASKYFKKACDKGFKGSCKNYKLAKEKDEQFKRIAEAFSHLSDKEMESLNNKVNEGLNYLDKGVIAEINGNIKQALKYYKKACDLGIKGGCNSYKSLKNKK